MQLTNVTGVSLPLAVWLAADGYDFTARGKAISATSLLKPVRQILLKERLTEENRLQTDVTDLIASRLGHTIHDGIEKAWTRDYKSSLKKLGYPDAVIDRIRVNPVVKEPGMIPVWLEQRSEREVMGYKISGKFDMVLEGELQDFKSTSVYSWISGSKDEDYILQGSIYRWLNPHLVTSDFLTIHFIFTDWSKAMAKRGGDNYPQQRVMPKQYELMSVEETDAWIRNKIRSLEAVADLDEPDLPRCTDKDLWRSDPKYKYYADPTKTSGRSTRNFDTLKEAEAYKASKGGKGIVITVPGQVKACSYCPAFPICTQQLEYDHG